MTQKATIPDARDALAEIENDADETSPCYYVRCGAARPTPCTCTHATGSASCPQHGLGAR